jgi:hypothetical protein
VKNVYASDLLAVVVLDGVCPPAQVTLPGQTMALPAVASFTVIMVNAVIFVPLGGLVNANVVLLAMVTTNALPELRSIVVLAVLAVIYTVLSVFTEVVPDNDPEKVLAVSRPVDGLYFIGRVVDTVAVCPLPAAATPTI